jgi:hypothetical protein
MNFMATSLKPFCSNRLMISPTSPRWTPSGLIMMKVCSRAPSPDIVEQGEVKGQYSSRESEQNDVFTVRIVKRKSEITAGNISRHLSCCSRSTTTFIIVNHNHHCENLNFPNFPISLIVVSFSLSFALAGICKRLLAHLHATEFLSSSIIM